MRIDDLKLFMLIAELGGFSAAADALNLPRANVSRRINALEVELQGKLFTRTTRRLTLTPTGYDYFQKLQDILPQLESANDVIKNQSHTPTGNVRLGLLSDADILAHELLQNFLQKYPQITIETHISNLGYHDIMNFGLDACVHIGDINDSSFIARPLGSLRRKLYASPDYLARNGTPTSLEDLTDHSLIISRFADERLENHWKFNTGKIKVNSRLISNSSHYIRHAVLKGAGISLLSEINTKENVQSGQLVEVMSDHYSDLDNAWLVYPSRKGISYAARLLIDYLLEEARKIS